MLLMQPSRLKFISNQFHILYTCKITTATGWQPNIIITVIIITHLTCFLSLSPVRLPLTTPPSFHNPSLRHAKQYLDLYGRYKLRDSLSFVRNHFHWLVRMFLYRAFCLTLSILFPIDSLGSKILHLRPRFVLLLFCPHALTYRGFSRDVIGWEFHENSTQSKPHLTAGPNRNSVPHPPSLTL